MAQFSLNQCITLLMIGSMIFSGLPAQAQFTQALQEKFYRGKFYKPPLPPAKFLNKRQEEISKQQAPKLINLITFVDSCDSHPELKTFEKSIKPWTAAEKQDIESMLERLLQIAPGLLIRAGNGGKLDLVRIDKYQINESYFSSVHSAAACSCGSAIAITDLFFSRTRQFHGLVHELVHEADFGNRVSYSSEWINFIGPTISKNRIKFATSPKSSQSALSKELFEQSLYPSVYSLSSVKEALAEIIAAQVVGEFKEKASTSLDVFIDKLTTVDPKSIESGKRYVQAFTAFIRKDYEKAMGSFSELLVQEPKLAMAHGFLGISCDMLKKYEQAADECHKSVALLTDAGASWSEPDLLTFDQYTASAQWRAGDATRAISTMNELLLHEPFDGHALYAQSFYEGREGHYVAALRNLYLACHAEDYSHTFLHADGDIGAFTKVLEGDVKKFPGLYLVLLRRGHLLEWLGDRATEVEEKNGFYKRASSDYEAVLKEQETLSKETIFDCCNIQLKLNNIPGAAKFLLQAQKDMPDAIETAVLNTQLVAVQEKKTETADALKKLWKAHGEKMLALLSSNAGLPANAAKIFESSHENTIEGFTRDIKENPENTDAYWYRAKLYVEKKQFDQALPDCSKAIELAVKDTSYSQVKFARLYDCRAYVNRKLGNLSDALKDYTEAIELNPKDTYALLSRGDAYYLSDRLEEALNDLNNVISIDKDDARAYRTRGCIYKDRADHLKAIEDFSEVIRLEPKDDVFLVKRGIEEKTVGRIDDALKDFNQAILNNENNFYAYVWRGCIFFARKDFSKAKADFEKALSIKPDDKYAQKRLQEIMNEKGPA